MQREFMEFGLRNSLLRFGLTILVMLGCAVVFPRLSCAEPSDAQMARNQFIQSLPVLPWASVDETMFSDVQAPIQAMKSQYGGALLVSSGPSAETGGTFINLSSIAGLIANGNSPAYNASKAAVWLLSKNIALYCAKMKLDIRSNSIHPTFIDTPILDGFSARFGKEEAFAKLARQVPMGRIGEPTDIANAVLYLASDESKFMTGAEIKVDGGISAM